MGEDGVAAEQVAERAAVATAIVGPAAATTTVARRSRSSAPSSGGDPVLHSERLILNMGPQHPEHARRAAPLARARGRAVVGAEPTHGYLHRCIEKLCETRTLQGVHRAAGPLRLRLGLPHRARATCSRSRNFSGSRSTPKADYIRVLMSELVRITSHHTWFAAAGLDTGALTPFLYAFIDREEILDFFETVTGGRMMFNYFRPGGVKDDIQPGAPSETARVPRRRSTRSMDEYEALLTGNEIFRDRTRGVGILTLQTTSRTTASPARWRAASRRTTSTCAETNPTPPTTDIPVQRAARRGRRHLRPLRRPHRRDARVGAASRSRRSRACPRARTSPRACRASSSRPAGAAYREVESPRGELGVLVVSDGTAQPWRLKVRSPAFSNLHVAPADARRTAAWETSSPIVGSVDVVMGEIDR